MKTEVKTNEREEDGKRLDYGESGKTSAAAGHRLMREPQLVASPLGGPCQKPQPPRFYLSAVTGGYLAARAKHVGWLV